MVSTFYPPYSFGGDAIYIYRLANELAKLGHFVDVFHCEDAFLLLNKKQPTAEFPNHSRVKVFRLKSGRGFLSPLLTQQTGIPFFKNRLKTALENNNYDVIHYHNMSLIGITALSYGSAVKFYTTHEHWLICPMHVLWKFNREVCLSKDCLRCQLQGKRPPQFWRSTNLLEKMLRHVDWFLAPSRFTLQKHLDAGLNIPIRHFPYFLPASEENGESDPVRETTRPYFLFVGRLEEIKGVQNIIPVFRANPNFDLLIAGDGEFREILTKQAAGAENIKFLGRVSQEKLDRLYRRAVAVIVPSICYETFGIIIIEAFARRTPVIVNDLGALAEVVRESDGGLIYRNAQELWEAMKSLAENKNLRDFYGQNGYTAFDRYWSEKAHLREYLELVREELSKKRAKNELSANEEKLADAIL